MGVMKSTNGGISWLNISILVVGDKGTHCEAITVAPSNPAIVYAGGKKSDEPVIYRSADGGSAWEDITSNLTGLLSTDNTVRAIWISPHDPDAFIVGTSKGIFTCSIEERNQTHTWNMTTIDYSTRDFVYDQPMETIYAATSHGIMSSQDEGVTWYEVNEGLGFLESLCIDIDPYNRLLYVGTAGGSVWRLSLPRAAGDDFFVIVDDFETYTNNDQEGEAIWQAWIDGFSNPDNGSQIGYLLPPYTEQTIVHGGAQSMPYFYDNASGYSEASMTLNDRRDWTMYGVEMLTLWFHGDPVNAPESMYVAIANTRSTPAVIYHDDPEAPLTKEWTQWSIDLNAFADLGADLTDVDKLSIGFGDKFNRQAGGSGLMFFDDIRLYRPPEN